MRPRHVSYFGKGETGPESMSNPPLLSKLDDDPTEQTENADNIINTMLQLLNNDNGTEIRQFGLDLSGTPRILA